MRYTDSVRIDIDPQKRPVEGNFYRFTDKKLRTSQIIRSPFYYKI